MKQVDTDDNDSIDYQDGTVEAKKGSVEMVALPDEQSSGANPASAGAAPDDDADIDFFDDDLSD